MKDVSTFRDVGPFPLLPRRFTMDLPSPDTPPGGTNRSPTRRGRAARRPIFLVGAPRSGSTLLAEALGRAHEAIVAPDGQRRVADDPAELHPAARGWVSNRLVEVDATPATVIAARAALFADPGDADPSEGHGPEPRLVEHSPRNALRVPFLAATFPDATFVYLYRDPRETISSMLDAWRSGRFATYPGLPEWPGPPWSLLLVPGWRELRGKPLPEIVAHQWAITTTVLLDDLAELPPDRWAVTSASALTDDPDREQHRLGPLLGLTWDTPAPSDDTPAGRDRPDPRTWAHNAEELDAVWELVEPVARRAHELFAEPPPTVPIRSDTAARRSAKTAEPDGTPTPDFRSVYTPGFAEVLATTGCALIASTYQSGRVVLVRGDGERVNTHLRHFDSPMGIAVRGPELALGTRNTVWRFCDQPEAATSVDATGRTDACYQPRSAHVTGDVRVHDLAYDGAGELWMVATRFSCLATLDPAASFVPRWRPGFVSALGPEDRCHLNGLAMVEGRPRYVTVLGMTDTANGWREGKGTGGAVLDVDGGAPVATGLCMPHSPRWYAGRLWVLESGRGALCTVDVETGTVDTVAVLPGFTRGLSFAGPFAFVGLSQVREAVFSGLPLMEAGGERTCGVWVVDLRSGAVVSFLRFEGTVQELFEVAVLPRRFPELVEPGADASNDAFVLPTAALVDVVGGPPD